MYVYYHLYLSIKQKQGVQCKCPDNAYIKRSLLASQYLNRTLVWLDG